MLNNLGYRVKNQKESSPESIRGGIERKRHQEKDCKGFTLVELIVVIVILAILAAILIPGLLKWIDEAKKKQYELEARSIVQAAQAEVIKLYGKGELTYIGVDPRVCFSEQPAYYTDELENIRKVSGIDSVDFIQILFKRDNKGEIESVVINYYDSDGTKIVATFSAGDGKWEISKLPSSTP